MKLTQFQKEELISLIDIRIDTIEDDPDSATDFETEENLENLKNKINANSLDFTDKEKEFLIEEIENRIDVAEDNRGNEGNSVNGLIKSMNNILSKIYSDEKI